MGYKGYFPYWGKAAGAEFHLLSFHSLDVAAVGDALLSARSDWRTRLARLLGWQQAEAQSWLPFLIALHDLGKFSSAFQGLRCDIASSLRPDFRQRGHSERHDTLGFLLWRGGLHQSLVEQEAIPGLPGLRRRSPAPIDYLIRAVTGHHGRPPGQPANVYLPEWFDEADQGAAALFVRDAGKAILAPQIKWPESELQHIKRASWWLAGFTVLCDWLGSNRYYFPYHDEPTSLAKYWEATAERAEAAVADSGLSPVEPSRSFSFGDCFANPGRVKPTPLQKAARDCELEPEPQLVVLEDVTGAGKTEAAVLLASRMMGAGLADSLYFALPTMATANAMYGRLGRVYKRLFDDSCRPSLVLAHGRAGQMDEFRASILPPASDDVAAYGDHTTSATASCNAWLADNRKKALLANVGVGTIDQAMLAILHARHQSLRLLGLLGKLLIVDEVHACDAYMRRLLEQLLRAHARSGGSAILLSATLAIEQRQRLMEAFAEGRESDGATADNSISYPALHQYSSNGRHTLEVEPAASSERRVGVSFVCDVNDIQRALRETAANGGCACWVRNTVGDAIQAWNDLKQRYPDLDVQLFHARYCLDDRLKIERRILDQFGESSDAESRSGRVLIATQVIEQSLDVDFDLLVTDLAPMDRVIQRAGRLHRHPRELKGNRVEDEDQRGEPMILIHAPEWSEEPGTDWLAGTFSGTGAVYRKMDAHLWLTQSLLREKGGFRTPGDVRSLIEGVYGSDADQRVPEGLRETWQAWYGLELTDASVGSLNGIDIDGGYVSEGVWKEDTVTPTRLGDPSVTVVLGYCNGEKVANFSERGWAMSSLQILEKHAREGVKPNDVSGAAWDEWLESMPAKGRWVVPIVLSEHRGAWEGTATAADESATKFVYDAASGLAIKPRVAGNGNSN